MASRSLPPWIKATLKIAVAAVVALFLARTLHLEHTFWAPISAIICCLDDIDVATLVARRRLLGTSWDHDRSISDLPHTPWADLLLLCGCTPWTDLWPSQPPAQHLPLRGHRSDGCGHITGKNRGVVYGNYTVCGRGHWNPGSPRCGSVLAEVGC